MGADCSVNSVKVLDKFTVHFHKYRHNRASCDANCNSINISMALIEPMPVKEDPSPWLTRWSHLIKLNGRVLDVACGAGRHMQYLHNLGHQCLGVDRSPEALSEAQQFGQVLEADIENGPWPLTGQQFDLVLVTNYLWRPLMPQILESIAPEGLLIYETFAVGQETIGKPSRPDFLLTPGELIQRFESLHVIAYEDGYWDQPAKFVQRMVAAHQVNPSRRPFSLSSR
jgi:SAM-dependent methyltransferase